MKASLGSSFSQKTISRQSILIGNTEDL